MFPAMDRGAFQNGLRTTQRGVEKLAEQDGANLLSNLGDAGALPRRALPVDDTSLMWGPLGSGLTVDPADILARFYVRFVTQYDAKAKGSSRAHDAATAD
jgi:hypothetical protein